MDFTHCNTKKSRHSYFHNDKRNGIVLTPVTFHLALAMLLDFNIFIPSTVHSVPAMLSTSSKPWEQVIVTMAGVLKFRPEGIGVSYKLNK